MKSITDNINQKMGKLTNSLSMHLFLVPFTVMDNGFFMMVWTHDEKCDNPQPYLANLMTYRINVIIKLKELYGTSKT